MDFSPLQYDNIPFNQVSIHHKTTAGFMNWENSRFADYLKRNLRTAANVFLLLIEFKIESPHKIAGAFY